MVSLKQNFRIVRGDNVIQPFAITLDNSRTLDGSESWRLVIRETIRSPGVLTTLSKAAGTITIGTVNTIANCPTAVFSEATMPISAFPAHNTPRKYPYGLEMTKGGKVETVSQGLIEVISDVAR